MSQTTATLIRLQKAESFLTYQWPVGLSPNLETQVKLLRRQIPPKTMAVYNALKKTRTQAVAEVIEGVCQGCQQPVPGRVLADLEHGGDLASCPHCERFVYLAPAALAQAEN